MTLYFYSWQYLVRGWLYRDIIFSPLIILVRGWLYRDIIFSLLAIVGEGVIISWHHILTPDNIGEGVIISWHYIFTPGNIWWGGDYIVTLYFHSWQYLVWGWLYRDIIFPPLTIFGQGVIISCHNTFTPGNFWWGDDYITTLYFHPWQYLVRGLLYRDIFSPLITLVRGWLYRDIIFSLLTIFGEGMIISWHYILTPENIWWGGDYIVTYFHSW